MIGPGTKGGGQTHGRRKVSESGTAQVETPLRRGHVNRGAEGGGVWGGVKMIRSTSLFQDYCIKCSMEIICAGHLCVSEFFYTDYPDLLSRDP